MREKPEKSYKKGGIGAKTRSDNRLWLFLLI